MKPLQLGRRSLLVASLAAPILAAADAPARPLRWAEVAALATSLPLVQEAEARAEGAAGAADAAGALPNPAFTLSGGTGEAQDGSAQRREWGVSVELPLESLATRGPRVAAAQASERAAVAEAGVVRAQALRAVRREFVALAHGQAQLDTQLELEAQVARLAALVRARAERGEARPTEVPRVEVELERLRGAAARSRASAAAQRDRLSATLGRPVERVETDLERWPAPPPREELERRLLSGAPAVEAARSRVAAAEEEASAERRERIPKLALGAGHVDELDRRATAVTATVTLPLWNWNGGAIRRAEAGARAEQARLDATLREARAALGDAWHACVAGQAGVARFRAEVLPRAEGAARTVGRAFELGEAGLLDVLDARRVLLDTRREYLDLLLDMQNACGDLAALAGLELP